MEKKYSCGIHYGDNVHMDGNSNSVSKEWVQRLIKEIQPKAVLDVGNIPEKQIDLLREKGVRVDVVDTDIFALSFPEFSDRRYDLAIYSQTTEEISQEQVSLAIENICKCTDEVLFFPAYQIGEAEDALPPLNYGYWVEQFTYCGFSHDVKYDCSYLPADAMLFHRENRRGIELIRDYEEILFCRNKENALLRKQLQSQKEQNFHMEKELAAQRTKIRQQEETFKKRIDDCRASMQRAFSDEVEKRKYYEDRYYVNQKEKAMLQLYRIENVQRKDSLDILKKNIQNGSKNNLAAISIKAFFREKYLWEKENIRLLRMNKGYWAGVFNPVFYAENHPDVKAAYGQNEKKLLRHFIRKGMVEGRRACELDVNIYMSCNPDVVAVLKFDVRAYYLHYLTYGKRDGRRAY